MAVARKLLVVVWHVLNEEVAQKEADEERVAKARIHWSLDLRARGRGGVSSKEFVRRELTALGLGRGLESFGWAGKPISLPPLTQTG